MKSFLKIYKSIIVAILLFIFTVLIVKILANSDVFVNDIYPNFYNKLYPFYTKVFGNIPFSVGDLLYILLIVMLLWMLFMAFKFIYFRQKWRGILVLSRLIYGISFLYLIFNLFWGFNYYRNGFSFMIKQDNIEIEELKYIVKHILKQAKKERADLNEDEKGVFKYSEKEFEQSLPEELNSINNFDFVFKQIPAQSKKKYSLFSFFMRYFGVSGYYNPFTAEAQITSQIPSISKPFSMAHEQAHQMGYAPEYEANFIAYVTSMQSGSDALKYSAHIKSINYLLREIYPQDSVFVSEILNSYSVGMKRDRENYINYQKKYSGKAETVFSNLNDIYLKSNKQDGVVSYNYFVHLLVNYYRNN